MPAPADLRAQVAASYDSQDLPSWPNPHSDAKPPHDDEYSRVTEPSRYDIVHARAHIWASHLAGLKDVALDGTRLSSSRPGTLSLFLLTDNVPVMNAEDVTLAVLRVAVARPDLVITTLPDCGCDACDWGSADLLEAVDDAVLTVVGGPFVLLRNPKWHAQWHPGGGSSGGTADHTAAMDLCRRLADGEDIQLPDDTEAFVGRSWFG
ncbi:DUF6226 family protein [Allokutzneria albata]|uniref:Uncharacterized protein n=1 Tax=Allokutzneria albata TaxID=211114 RepID=A0A1G9S419_ALLAB|nr:DUF6226 family protein [Allokutzneria albata]SDM30249.1 hypothetical protein SAMN04489726_0878 [Allokutzneria albata]